MKVYNEEDRKRNTNKGLILVDSEVFDENPLTPLVASLSGALVEKAWKVGKVLNQLQYSCCVGCSVVNFMNADPIESQLTLEDALSVYRDAQNIDDLPGREPECQGTTIVAGMQVMRNRGWITDCKFTRSVVEMKRYIASRGPMILGTQWHANMDYPSASGFVSIGGRASGGHAYLCYGVSDQIDAFMCYNSWGDGYSQHGRFFVKTADMAHLLSEGGSIAASPIQRL